MPLGTVAGSNGGLLLDFPRVRHVGVATVPPRLQVVTPAVVAPSAGATREDWEQARLLLEESVDRGWRLLAQHDTSATTAGEPTHERLSGALAAARQLLARPDARTEDLLEFLADIEACIQLLSAPLDLAATKRDMARLRVVTCCIRGGVSNLADRMSEVEALALSAEAAMLRSRLEAGPLAAVAAAPSSAQGSLLALHHEFTDLCEQLDGTRTAVPVPPADEATKTVQPDGRPERTVGAHVRSLLGCGVSDPETNAAVVDGGGVGPVQVQESQQQLLEWPEGQLGEDDVGQLGELAGQARALAGAHREVLALACEASPALETTECEVGHASEETRQAVRELGSAAKAQPRRWVLKASLGGAAVGGTVGSLIAGPVGGVVGAGASAALGAIGGKTAKERHLHAVDRVVASVEPAPQ
mmetsp:Transcript_66467/g.131098  ORF Transcript_66467/g.131098 Transcript_66467/m.131098 type:complete len:416 (-) Transcript_66467:160-1407(-)